MARSSISKGPNYIHPEKASAVGSRNSNNRDGRDEYAEASMVIDEQIDKIINHISAKLPPEVVEKLHVGGTVKELLHNYFNQGYQNMFNRYLVTAEDEMAKKFRHLVDQQELQNLNHYTPREIPNLIDSIGGSGRFNSADVEKSIANIFGHLQGHVHKGVFDIEHATNKLLREKADIGAFVSDNNSYSIVKCYLRDNPIKPEAVTDIRLVINVAESELLKPIFHYQTASEIIIKDVISSHIMKLIDKEVNDINSQLIEENQSELSESDMLIEKMKKLENHINFDGEDENSAQYDFVAHKFIEKLKGLDAEIEHVDYDPLNVKENVYRIVEDDNMRHDGFNTAVNILTGILDSTQLGYQHIENFKNSRKLVIREYRDTNPRILPDERYSVTLTYYDDQQLRELRAAYCQQLDEMDAEVEKIRQVYDRVFLEQKQVQGVISFEDVATRVLPSNQPKSLGGWFQKEVIPEKEPPKKQWDEISFVLPEKNDQEKLNDTFKEKRQYIVRKFALIRARLKELFGWANPPERVILEQRIDFMEEKFGDFNRGYNPFHLQAGLVVDITVSTIKRKEITMNGMSLVLNDFLARVSSGFSDRAMVDHQKQKTITHQNATNGTFAAGS